jgi:hypothetical protein
MSSLSSSQTKKMGGGNNPIGAYIGFSNNLKEIYMNRSRFCCSDSRKEEMSNLTNPAFNNEFMLHNCYKTLERVSIRTASWDSRRGEYTIIQQNALIKFVRNVPSLRWFRSDLTKK